MVALAAATLACTPPVWAPVEMVRMARLGGQFNSGSGRGYGSGGGAGSYSCAYAGGGGSSGTGEFGPSGCTGSYSLAVGDLVPAPG